MIHSIKIEYSDIRDLEKCVSAVAAMVCEGRADVGEGLFTLPGYSLGDPLLQRGYVCWKAKGEKSEAKER